jgi:protein-L-isoaspartate O-methyltransferase
VALPPSWLAQLHDSGTLIVPLRMNGVTRSIGFRKHDGHLASTAAHTCLRCEGVDLGEESPPLGTAVRPYSRIQKTAKRVSGSKFSMGISSRRSAVASRTLRRARVR